MITQEASNCCDASLIGESDMCSECKEHAGIVKTIGVLHEPSTYKASKFWFTNHKVSGIAEWEDVCEHDNVTYDVEFDDYDHDWWIEPETIECQDCTMTIAQKEDWARENKYNI